MALLAFGFVSQANAQEIKAEFKKEVKVEKIFPTFLIILKTLKEMFRWLFLHGSGERGTNLEMVKTHSPFILIKI